MLSQSKHLTQSLMPWRCSGKAVEGRRQASKEHWRVPALTVLSDPGSRLSARLPWPRWQHVLSQRNRRALKALWSHQPGRRNHQWQSGERMRQSGQQLEQMASVYDRQAQGPHWLFLSHACGPRFSPGPLSSSLYAAAERSAHPVSGSPALSGPSLGILPLLRSTTYQNPS